ncbi:N-acyl-L-amino acid amidohydrolase [Bradyrhizobium sp. SSBR45G]|uniref:amidohydrolase n=1 Tax=unclassified Bradyrhizobium TaxID=2631580 RepID=UPI002342B55F|nr:MULTISPECIES: amidohydrolase [unclassified Bradyrhizobium]GLH75670.1 N-acyl-L-amino acid amidohydrolase [Bradyrhizobium sp. SSBR45G]GLH85764.1 N-acyl-L-amino acid amidohydrolase [Bradyrhizobium sp. SSBR45R]
MKQSLGLLFASATLIALAAPPAHAELDVAALKSTIAASLERDYPALDELYKDLHAHPELAFQEVETAAKLAEQMRGLGFEVTEKVGKTGLVALYRNGDGPTVMVRTELDALPMEEKTGLPYASHDKANWNGRETFVAHGCGHDVHMASWVGTAKTLVSLKDKWKGTLMFVAQPAQEEVAGAKAMLADGLFTRFPKPDVGFALHTGGFAHGEVTYRAGVGSPSMDALSIHFDDGVHDNPLMMAGRFLVDLQSMISREKDPTEPGVLVGAIRGGTASESLQKALVVPLTIRSFRPEARAKMLEEIERTAKAGAPSPGIELEQRTDAVINDDAVVAAAEPVLKAAFGDRLTRSPPSTEGDDYSEYVKAGVPSMVFSIGVHDPERVAAARHDGPRLPPNHSQRFAPVPRPTIETGITAMTLAVLSAFDARANGH